jgi:hypothetical protein
MVTHIMKTTVEIADDLIARAKALAIRRNTTLRALIEQGLRQVLSDEQQPADFRLRDGSVDGQGLRDEFRDKDWAALRRAAYEDHGG